MIDQWVCFPPSNQSHKRLSVLHPISETKVQCPLPNSEPQIDKETGSIVECMHRPCMSNYRCVFASYGRGKYICCSKPKKPRDESDLAPDNTEDYEENYGQVVATTRQVWSFQNIYCLISDPLGFLLRQDLSKLPGHPSLLRLQDGQQLLPGHKTTIGEVMEETGTPVMELGTEAIGTMRRDGFLTREQLYLKPGETTTLHGTTM